MSDRVRDLCWQLVRQTMEIVSTLNELQVEQLSESDQMWLHAPAATLHSACMEVEGLFDMARAGDQRPLKTVNAALKATAT